MKKLLSILLSALVVITMLTPMLVSASDMSNTNIQTAGIHDPSIFKDKDGKYYIVGSHLVMASSDDMIDWKMSDSTIDGVSYLGENWKETLAEPLKWTSAWQDWCIEENAKADKQGIARPMPDFTGSNYNYNCWANDIIYNEKMGKYCLYGACSVWGATCSVIWLCTSDNVEGPYEYVKSFVYTGITRNNERNPRYNGLYYADTNIKTDLIDTGLITDKEVKAMPWFYVKDPNNTDWWYGQFMERNEGGYDCSLGKYPNAIDPAPFTDANGDMWLVYGSYSGGCFVLKLDNETGLPDYQYNKDHEKDGYDIYFGKRVSNTNEGTGGTGEGPYIQYDSKSGYFYFFLTYGGLNEDGGYNIREYRSKNPDGPYLDAAGNDARDMKNTGLQLEGNYQFSSQKTASLSGGHSSCLVDDDGSMYQIYHSRYLGYWGWFDTVIHKMARTENGWSVMLPYQYQGEKDITSIDENEVVGIYEFVDSTNQIQSLGWNHKEGGNINDNFRDIVIPTQTIALNVDGTISNVKTVDYVDVRKDSEEHDIRGFVLGDAVGTWSLKNDSTYVNFKINDVNYSGVFAKQFDESGDKNEVTVFSAAGDNNTSIWGVKNDNHKIVYDSTVNPTCTSIGYDVYNCTDCEVTLKNNKTSMLAHNYKLNKTVAPTCTAKGYEIHKCETCGTTVKKNYVDKLGHSYKKVVYAPTCVKKGYTKYTCTRCGDSYTSNTVSATGKHKYDSGKVTKKPTTTNAGVMTYTCTVCKAKKTVSISKLVKASISGLTAKSKAFTVKWGKVSSATGYQIQYSTSSSFTNAKTKLITKNSTLSTTISKLTAKKKYYVRIRTYRTINGTKYYSSWSTKKYVTTKK